MATRTEAQFGHCISSSSGFSSFRRASCSLNTAPHTLHTTNEGHFGLAVDHQFISINGTFEVFAQIQAGVDCVALTFLHFY